MKHKDDFGFWFDVAAESTVRNDVLLLKDCVADIHKAIAKFDGIVRSSAADRNSKAIRIMATEGKLPKAGVK